MGQLATRPQPQFAVTVLTGAEKGATYQLIDGRIRIGRGDDNDIIIKDDPKISRHHALLTIHSQGVNITVVSDRNSVIVNGQQVREAALVAGAVIQLGQTKLQFNSLLGGALENVSAQPGGSPSVAMPSMGVTNRAQAQKTRFYMIVLGIGLLLAWLLTSTETEEKTVEIRTEEDVQSDIASHNKVVEEIGAERKRLGLDTRQFDEAQPNFIKGFRDYRKGQYERAIESFQACLSLFPNHQQCHRYLRLSQKKFSELVQYHMVLANKYRAQNQYGACQASYRNVMVMLKNPTDKTYVEAKAGFDACQALEGDRY